MTGEGKRHSHAQHIPALHSYTVEHSNTWAVAHYSFELTTRCCIAFVLETESLTGWSLLCYLYNTAVKTACENVLMHGLAALQTPGKTVTQPWSTVYTKNQRAGLEDKSDYQYKEKHWLLGRDSICCDVELTVLTPVSPIVNGRYRYHRWNESACVISYMIWLLHTNYWTHLE